MARSTTPSRPTITSLLPDDWVAGRHVTVTDYIVEQVNAGVDPITAAQTAGVSPPEFLAWMREGALTRASLDAGAIWESDFTPEQQDSLILADRVNRAHATHIARLAAIAEQLARGGIERIITRTRSEAGQVVELTETVEHTLPDRAMLQWKLEKLEPAVYGSKATLNVTVVDLTDTAEVANSMEQRMADIARALGNTHYDAIPADSWSDDDDDDA